MITIGIMSPMSGASDHQRLERDFLRLKADYDQLQRHAENLEHNNADLEHDLQRSRTSEQVLKAQLHELQGDHRALLTQHNDLIDLIANKQESIHKLLRRMFGNSRERFVPGQEIIGAVAAILAESGMADGPAAGLTGSLFGEDTASGTENVTPKPPTPDPKTQKRPEGSGGRKPLPADLPRQHETYTPPADHPMLKDADAIRLIGRAMIERLDVTPFEWQVAVTSCPVVEITKGGCTMQVTVTPPAVIERGQVTDRALIRIVIDKHADHLPYYRQEQRAARRDLPLPRSKLCRWQQRLAGFLEPVYDEQLRVLMEEPCLGIDDSVMRRWDLGAGSGRCKQGRLWAVSGLAGWYYMATATRGSEWITDLLDQYSGAIMGDACASHKPLLERDDILALFCWAHVRRKFFESSPSSQRDEMLALIQQLYAVEDVVRQAPVEQVLFARRRHAQAVLDAIKGRLDAWLEEPSILPDSDLGKAVRYAHPRWDGLTRYVDLPAAPIDNNDCERGMRPNALHRKNALFHASEKGARSYAILQTLIQSAVKLGMDPEAYLGGITAALHAGRDPADLVPIRWKAHGLPDADAACS
jgi:transposase